MKKVAISNNIGYGFLIENPEEAKVVIEKWRIAGKLLKLERNACFSANYDVAADFKSPVDFKSSIDDALCDSSDIIFDNVDLTEIDWTDVPLYNFTFTGNCIVDTNKMISESYYEINGCVFMDMDMTNVDWNMKSVDYTIFDNCKIHVRDILSRTAHSSGNVFTHMDLEGVDWTGTSVYNSIFHSTKVNFVDMIRDAGTVFGGHFVDLDLTGVDVDLTKHSMPYLDLCRFSNCTGISDEFKYKIARHNILSYELFERNEEPELRDVISIYDPRFKTNKSESELDSEINNLVDVVFNGGDGLKEHIERVRSIENILTDIRTNIATKIN